MGARGMGPLRAALEWTPVQAHATANPVSLFYITQCQQSAAYLADWDQWREAGVRFRKQFGNPYLCLSSRAFHMAASFSLHHAVDVYSGVRQCQMLLKLAVLFYEHCTSKMHTAAKEIS